MKLLVLISLTVLAVGGNAASHQDLITKSVASYNYPIQTYAVTTDDGYILQIHRIPWGYQGSHEQNQGQSKNKQERPAVLLMHGFLSSAEDFIYGGPSQGLAFYLADKGYDVYIGNARGSICGQRHTTLNPSTDPAFWRFSFHEIGIYDLPAIIDKIIFVSGQRKIQYVGHTEGSSVFYILASERPHYQQKIERMLALGPVVYLQQSTHPLLQNVAQHYNDQSWIIKNLGMNVFKPSPQLISNLQEECQQIQKGRQQQQICQNVYFLFNGFNSNNFNQTTVQKALSRVPSGGSVRQVLHLAQMKKDERFESYQISNEKEEAYEYNLSKVTIPIAIFYTEEDALSQPTDVVTLINILPNVYKKQLNSDYSNNMDFIYGNKLQKFNKNILDALQEVLQHNEERRDHYM